MSVNPGEIIMTLYNGMPQSSGIKEGLDGPLLTQSQKEPQGLRQR